MVSDLFDPSTTVYFILKNNSSINRSIKVFGTKIMPGATLDVMKIPGVTEEDIKAEITKGSLKSLLQGGSLQVVSSSVNFTTTDSAQGAFLRSLGLTGTSDNTEALTQSDWYIDPVNGSDLNSGKDSSTPIKTWKEFNKRIGSGSFLPGRLSTAISPLQLIVINVLDDGSASDPIEFNVKLNTATLLAIVGKATTIASGTISAFTAKDRATNQANEITDTLQTWSSLIGKRIRNTTVGPNLGQIAWVAKDLGSGVARISCPSNPNLPDPPDRLFQTTVTDGVFSPGDTYVVEDLTKAYVGNMAVEPAFSGGSFLATVGFHSFDFQRVAAAVPPYMTTDRADTVIKGCRFNVSFQMRSVFSARYLLNCCMVGGFIVPPGTAIIVRSGLSLGSVFAITETSFTNDHIVQGGGVSSFDYGQLSISTLGVFDATGSAINVRRARVYIDNFFGASTQGLWGSGSTGFGVEVFGGGRLVYNTTIPTVTGSLGDFKLAGSTTSTTYNPADGYFVNPEVSNTWANLALPIGSGGLGGNALNPARSAKIVKLS